MELKSPTKNIRIAGCAGVIAGAAIIATHSEGFVHTFGVGILAGGARFADASFLRSKRPEMTGCSE